ncbi:MAG: bacillithiol system redox-active protein YtxJ [Chitinophagaceae bacterium]|nr:bacillithiol system redox-active protein YtxJ [Chitinophagaceae bacterium]
MNWKYLESPEELDHIVAASHNSPQVIFKHSTRCNISAMAKSRLERAQKPDEITFYYLDLLSFRPISNKIAEIFHVEHESPQVLVIKDGKCIYSESHSGIQMDEILEHTVLN